MEQSTVSVVKVKPAPRKKVVVEIQQNGTFTANFSVKEGEIPVTRRDLNLILRVLRVEYGNYSRQILIQQSLKQKAQGVNNAVA